MGTDTPIAALSNRPRLLFDYFAQLFAQVTNPPLDAIREEIVTSLNTTIGRELNLLDAGPEHCGHIVLSFPVIDNDELAKILHIDADGDTHTPAQRSRCSTASRMVPLASNGASTRSVKRSIPWWTAGRIHRAVRP